MPRKNVVLVRHGDCIMQYHGQDCGLSEQGREQMTLLGREVESLLRPNTLILESPLKRSTQSTDCIVESLQHGDYSRQPEVRLTDNTKYAPLFDEIDQHAGDVLIVTHTPLLKNLFEEIMKNEYPFGHLPQGTIMRFQSVLDDNHLKSNYAFLGIS